MGTSYAVTWRARDGGYCAGSLELAPDALRMEGVGPSGTMARELPYEELRGVRVGREPRERIAGRPSLVLETAGGEIRLAGVAQPGIVTELAERLLEIVAEDRSRSKQVVFVVPYRRRSRDAVRRLLEAGPPFDPVALELDDHHVFLTDREAIFVFESRSPEGIARLLRDPRVVAAARGWAPHLAGPPRIADAAFTWRGASD